MEKIIFIHSRQHLDDDGMSFAISLAMQTRSAITGVWVDDGSVTSTGKDFRHSYFKEVVQRSHRSETVVDPDQAVHYFLETCAARGVNADVYEDRGNPLEEIVYESRYADVLVLSPFASFQNEDELPTGFVRHVLSGSECPVVIAPRHPVKPEEIVFCYDGSASSMFAIKQFTYLFPHFRQKHIVVIEMREKKLVETESHERLHDWLKAHYKSSGFHYLQGKVKDELFTYLLNKDDLFIVMGAYGRGLLSVFFRRSASDLVMKTVDLPIFITHH